jgi:hypothetical protein
VLEAEQGLSRSSIAARGGACSRGLTGRNASLWPSRTIHVSLNRADCLAS